MQIDQSLSLPKETQPFKICSDWQVSFVKPTVAQCLLSG